MTEHQYRVIKDRNKGDDPQLTDVEVGDRWTLEALSLSVDQVVRIERPVTATDEPERCEQCDDFEPETHAHPSVPTREQIDRAVGEVLFNVSNFPPAVQARMLGQDMSGLRGTVTDAVLALLNGADR